MKFVAETVLQRWKANAVRRARERWLRNSVGALLCSALVLYVVAVAERIDLEAPSPTPILLDQQGYFLAQFGVNWTGPDGTRRTEYGYWPLEALPERVVAATLALEDKRFWDHPGVDGLAVLRAVWQAARSGRGRRAAAGHGRARPPSPCRWCGCNIPRRATCGTNWSRRARRYG